MRWTLSIGCFWSRVDRPHQCQVLSEKRRKSKLAVQFLTFLRLNKSQRVGSMTKRFPTSSQSSTSSKIQVLRYHFITQWNLSLACPGTNLAAGTNQLKAWTVWPQVSIDNLFSASDKNPYRAWVTLFLKSSPWSTLLSLAISHSAEIKSHSTQKKVLIIIWKISGIKRFRFKIKTRISTGAQVPMT